MTARPVSAGQDSTSGSSAAEVTIGVSKLAPLPEQWTLPKEWNIEKRETFAFWKMDVQNQIANISGTLERSLSAFPHPDVSRHMTCQDQQTIAQLEQEKRERSLLAGNTLNYGLARKLHTDFI
ncbi:LOW QUALITY PROTEIN: uncharacterized protein LOC135461274 [Liolophura sinensis]|uniref:LOW QUALITY PROTEIN: uncharacterized protein LOC135461274 n=1 Tax=Liolophura sinensis TaxID=3198878 RepID=UPI0031586EF1